VFRKCAHLVRTVSKRLCGTSRLSAIPFIALLALCDASTAPTPDSSVPAMPDPGYTAYVDDITTDAVTVPAGGAEAIFIAGGDQSTYVNLWTGTSLVSAVNARVAQGYPIGGTSAGLAVLGTYVYAALNASSVSSTVMANPDDVSLTLQPALFLVPLLRNVLTDSHSRTRDRMERLTTFMARLQQDGLAAPSTSPLAIDVDEQSGVASR